MTASPTISPPAYKSKYTNKQVNKDFLFRLALHRCPPIASASKVRELISDDQLFDKLVDRAYEKGEDKIIQKLRRGLIIVFVSR